MLIFIKQYLLLLQTNHLNQIIMEISDHYEKKNSVVSNDNKLTPPLITYIKHMTAIRLQPAITMNVIPCIVVCVWAYILLKTVDPARLDMTLIIYIAANNEPVDK